MTLEKESANENSKSTSHEDRGSSRGKGDAVTRSYLISLAGFVVGMIFCTIQDGEFDHGITLYLSNQVTFFNDIGIAGFMEPSIIDFNSWTTFQIGSYIGIFVIVVAAILTGIAGKEISAENKKAQEEKRLPGITANGKYLKYGAVILATGLVAGLGIPLLLNFLFARATPAQALRDLLPGQNAFDQGTFKPWYDPDFLGGLAGGGDLLNGFVSSNVALAVSTLGLGICFKGARNKALAPVVSGLGGVYAVLMALGQMAARGAWFSSVLLGGFIAYTTLVIIYKWIASIESQEDIYRYRLVHDPFMHGYRLILKAKKSLADDPENAIQMVNDGLALLDQSREKIVDLESIGVEFTSLKDRIDDLKERFTGLIEEFRQLPSRSGEPLERYMLKWSYVF